MQPKQSKGIDSTPPVVEVEVDVVDVTAVVPVVPVVPVTELLPVDGSPVVAVVAVEVSPVLVAAEDVEDVDEDVEDEDDEDDDEDGEVEDELVTPVLVIEVLPTGVGGQPASAVTKRASARGARWTVGVVAAGSCMAE